MFNFRNITPRHPLQKTGIDIFGLTVKPCGRSNVFYNSMQAKRALLEIFRFYDIICGEGVLEEYLQVFLISTRMNLRVYLYSVDAVGLRTGAKK